MTSANERLERLQDLLTLSKNASRSGLASAPADFIPPWLTDTSYVPPTQRNSIVAKCAALLALVILIFLLRIAARLVCLRRLRWDDYLIIPGVMFTIALAAIEINWTYHALGMHIWDATMEQVRVGYMYLYIHLLLHPAAVHMVKLSILWFFYTLTTKGTNMRIVVIGYMIFQVVFLIITLSVFAFQCRPVRAGWDLLARFDANSTCLPIGGLYFSFASIHLVSDFIMLLLPIPIIWKLRLQPRKKIVVCGLFGLGIVATIAAAIRLSYIRNVVNDFDLTWSCVNPGNWGVAECSAAIICASIPPLKPLVERISPNILGRTLRTGNSSFGGFGSSKQGSNQAWKQLSGYDVEKTVELRTFSSVKSPSLKSDHGNGFEFGFTETKITGGDYEGSRHSSFTGKDSHMDVQLQKPKSTWQEGKSGLR